MEDVVNLPRSSSSGGQPIVLDWSKGFASGCSHPKKTMVLMNASGIRVRPERGMESESALERQVGCYYEVIWAGARNLM